MIKERLVEATDMLNWETQYGFRKNKSTADAIYILRKMLELQERHKQPGYFLFIDWEKAFDSIDHNAMFTALERMGTPQKIVNIIKQSYANTTFQVNKDGELSGVKIQGSGIRQGCPLSPYLFVLVMTAKQNSRYKTGRITICR